MFFSQSKLFRAAASSLLIFALASCSRQSAEDVQSDVPKTRQDEVNATVQRLNDLAEQAAEMSANTDKAAQFQRTAAQAQQVAEEVKADAPKTRKEAATETATRLNEAVAEMTATSQNKAKTEQLQRSSEMAKRVAEAVQPDQADGTAPAPVPVAKPE